MSVDTAENVAVSLPVLNTEINISAIHLSLNESTESKNCAKGRISCKEWLK